MFDGAALQGYLKSMLSSRCALGLTCCSTGLTFKHRLSTVSWSPAAAKTLGDRIAVDVKRRMQGAYRALPFSDSI